eukprot:GILJ01007821.1.p1 GENE.GILJ01007821.1~~GILJ01007821.1.p1  ORF type:complete len:1916 (-),score=280.75 GILJ01007821.1:158-5584(-)
MLVQFVCERLNVGFSNATRLQAGQNLGLLSRSFMHDILPLYFAANLKCKKKEHFVEYVWYQLATRHFAFSVNTPEDTALLIEYLRDLRKLCDKSIPSVLKAEICQSLEAVFSRIMNSSDEEMKRAWAAFSGDKDGLSAEFWQLYEYFYTTVLKWAKKKESIYSLVFIRTVICLGGKEWYYSARVELFLKQLFTAYKSKEFRAAALAETANLIANLQKEVVTYNSEIFTEHIKQINGILFGKGFHTSEMESITRIVYEEGVKHVHFVARLLQDMLAEKLPHDHHAVALQALGMLAKDFPVEVNSYNFSLGPILFDLLVGADSRVNQTTPNSLMKAALPCFGRIPHPNPDKIKILASCVVDIAVFGDKSMSAVAVESLVDYCLNNVYSHVPAVLEEVLFRLEYVNSLGQSELIQGLYLVERLFWIFSDEGRATVPTSLDLAAWKNRWYEMRLELEASCISWLCHWNVHVRKTVATILTSLRRKCMKSLETSGGHSEADGEPVQARAPLLCESNSLSPRSDWSETAFAAELENLIATEQALYSVVLCKAWNLIQRRWKVSVDSKHALQEGQLTLLQNHLRFLCLMLHCRAYVPKHFQREGKNSLSQNAKHPVEPTVERYSQPDSISDEAIAVFLGDIIYLVRKEDEEGKIWDIVVDTVLLLNSSFFVPLIEMMRDAVAQMKGGFDKNWYWRERSLHFTTNLLCEVDDLAENCIYFLGELVKGFLSSPTDLLSETHPTLTAEVSLAMRQHALLLVKLYIVKTSAAAEASTRAGLLTLLLNWVPQSADLGTAIATTVESRFVDAMTAWLDLGAVKEIDAEQKILNLLQAVFLRTPSLQLKTADAFRAFLGANPHRLRTFFSASIPDVYPHLQAEDAERLGLVFLDAIVQNTYKHELSARFATELHPVSTWVWVLLHMSSDANGVRREKAIELVRSWTRLDSEFRVHIDSDIPGVTAVEHHIFAGWTRRTSQALSVLYGATYTPILFEEAAKLAPSLRSSSHAALLQFLHPWMQPFLSKQVPDKESQVTRFVQDLLSLSTSVLYKTKEVDRTEKRSAQQHGVFVFPCSLSISRSVEDMWILLFSYKPLHKKLLPEFLHTMHCEVTKEVQRCIEVPAVPAHPVDGPQFLSFDKTPSAVHKGSDKSRESTPVAGKAAASPVSTSALPIPAAPAVPASLKTLSPLENPTLVNSCSVSVFRFVLVLLTRVASHETIVEFFAEKFRSYQQTKVQSMSVAEYFEWKQGHTAHAEENCTPEEYASLLLVLDVLYEVDLALLPHLSHLLQTMFVLFDGSVQSSVGVSNILQSLVLRKSLQESDTAAVQRLTKDICLKLRKPLSNGQGLIGSSWPGVRQLLKLLHPLAPNLSEQWSREALSWALNSLDRTLIRRSWTLYAELTHEVDETSFRQILTCFYKALEMNDEDAVSVYKTLIFSLLTEKKLQSFASLQLCGRIAIALLVSPELGTYRIASTLLQLIFATQRGEVEQNEEDVVGSLEDDWKKCFETQYMLLPETLLHVLSAGLLTEATQMQTMSLLQTIHGHYHSLWPKENAIFSAVMLARLCRALSSPPDVSINWFDELDALEVFMKTSAYCLDPLFAVIAELKEQFSPADLLPQTETVDRLTTAMAKTFQLSKDMPSFFEILASYLWKGPKQWTSTLLRIMFRLLQATPNSTWIPLFVHVAELVGEYFGQVEPAHVHTLVDLYLFLVNNAPEGFPSEVFQFRRAKSVLAEARSSLHVGCFPGVTAAVASKRTEAALELFADALLGRNSEPADTPRYDRVFSVVPGAGTPPPPPAPTAPTAAVTAVTAVITALQEPTV